MIGKFRIITFGLTEMQNAFVGSCFPNRNYELVDTDVSTDLIAIPSTVVIINAEALDTDSIEMLFDFYMEVDGCSEQTVIWLGTHKPPKKIWKFIKCYDSFDKVADNLKYLLLTANSRMKKAIDYSKSLTFGIKILSLIRNVPGISTKEISEQIELPIRSVLRYIAALKATGEWIQYDTNKRGWELFQGKSILFGDF